MKKRILEQILLNILESNGPLMDNNPEYDI